MACFAAHQGAGKAVKTVFQKRNLEARGHAVSLNQPERAPCLQRPLRLWGNLFTFRSCGFGSYETRALMSNEAMGFTAPLSSDSAASFSKVPPRVPGKTDIITRLISAPTARIARVVDSLNHGPTGGSSTGNLVIRPSSRSIIKIRSPRLILPSPLTSAAKKEWSLGFGIATRPTSQSINR